MTHPLDPDWVVPTKEALQDWLDELGLSPRLAAAGHYAKGEARDWATAKLQAVLDDQPVDEVGFQVLEVVTGISAMFWRSFERIYREGLAAGKKPL